MKSEKKLKIAVNTRLLLKGRLEGIGRFTHECLKYITQQHPEHEFHFFFDRKYNQDFIYSDNIKAYSIPPQARHPILYKLWFEYSLPYYINKIQPDLFLSTDNYTSLRANVKKHTVIHDINFEHHPELFPATVLRYYKKNMRQFALASDGISTVSEFSKQDLCTTYQLQEDKVDVVYNGCSDFVTLNLPAAEQDQIRKKYTNGDPYFIYVGSIHGRKNVKMLLKAFDSYKKQYNSPLKLVIVGEKMWKDASYENLWQSLQYQDEIIFTGRIHDDELARIYSSAYALCFVSLFEGFGLPIVEAFKAGIPIITSNRTSMPEIAGDAALLVNPESEDEIVGAMHQLWDDKKLYADLQQKGHARQDVFNWERSAQLLWEAMLKTINK